LDSIALAGLCCGFDAQPLLATLSATQVAIVIKRKNRSSVMGSKILHSQNFVGF